MMITKEDFDSWRSNPVTKAVFAKIDDEIESKSRSLLLQRTVPSQIEIENIRGRAQAFADLRGMEFVEDGE